MVVAVDLVPLVTVLLLPVTETTVSTVSNGTLVAPCMEHWLTLDSSLEVWLDLLESIPGPKSSWIKSSYHITMTYY